MNIKDFKLVEFFINLGEEDIKISIQEDVFSVSTAKTKELEDEIIAKIEREAKKNIQASVLNSLDGWEFMTNI